jgi:hypothetical protein
MTAPAIDRRAVAATTVRITTAIGGGAVGGLIGSIMFLYVAHQGNKRGYTDQDWVRGFGNLLGGEGGAEIVRRGLWVTLVTFAIVGMIVMPLLGLLMGGRPWYHQAVPVFIVAFLAWGLVFSPLFGADSESVPGGLFGVDAGGGTWLVYLVACAALAATMARVATLITTPAFWETKHLDLREDLEALDALGLQPTDIEEPQGAGLLEFPEERRE